MIENHRHLPENNRLSVLIAAIMLAFALGRLIETKGYQLDFSMMGIAFSFPLNLNIASTIMASALTAAGMDWLLRGHPHLDAENSLQHWILPALTAFILGLPLNILPFGMSWWLTFGAGGVLLIFIFIAEYIALDPSDIRYPAASAGLVALSYTLFLVLMITLTYFNVRLFLVGFLVFISSSLVVLRALHLRTGDWEFSWSIGIAIILTQLSAAIHYWPVQPIQYSLFLIGPLFTLTELAHNQLEKVPLRRSSLEVVIGLGLFWFAAVLIRS